MIDRKKIILFLVLICSKFFSQTLSEIDIIGKWEHTTVKLSKDSIAVYTAIFREGIYEFLDNKSFTYQSEDGFDKFTIHGSWNINSDSTITLFQKTRTPKNKKLPPFPASQYKLKLVLDQSVIYLANCTYVVSEDHYQTYLYKKIQNQLSR